MENTTTQTPQFTNGQKVRTIWGTTVTVLEQVGNTVYIYEGPLDWYHVTKVFPINEKESK